MASLHPPKYLELLRRSIDDMTALSTGNLDVAVSDCPGWKISDLLGHVGQVFAMVDAIVIPRSQVRVGPGDEIRPADGQDVLEWFAARAGSMLNTLENTDPSETLWTWSDRQDAVDRRAAHERATRARRGGHVRDRTDLQAPAALVLTLHRDLRGLCTVARAARHGHGHHQHLQADHRIRLG